jgi:hypothetical protein
MIIDMLIGATAMAAILFLLHYVREEKLKISWWKWTLTVSCTFYIIFVLQMILGFLNEYEPRAALVMGVLTGLPGVIGAVLLKRFVFGRTQ